MPIFRQPQEPLLLPWPVLKEGICVLMDGTELSQEPLGGRPTIGYGGLARARDVKESISIAIFSMEKAQVVKRLGLIGR